MRAVRSSHALKRYICPPAAKSTFFRKLLPQATFFESKGSIEKNFVRTFETRGLRLVTPTPHRSVPNALTGLMSSGQIPEPTRLVAAGIPLGIRRLLPKATQRALSVWSIQSTN